jgi:site-specific DNA recombinase
MRTVIYARYSSDLQREASIEDQVRLCRERIDREGWTYLHAYTDRAQSGASTLRRAYQQLLEGARARKFDVVVAEALDRLSRDQEDVAALYKRLTFAGVRLVTLAEGEISELHVGLKGTMNALFLKDLAAKTHRGLRGRVEQGRSGGGNAFGYTVVRERDAAGEAVRGLRRIDEAEAALVRRIFTDFAAGRSPRSIAASLNAQGVPAPSGGTWSASTIHGNWRRGTGILNNELYIGRLVWNRQRFEKDPETGRRQARPNPEPAWIVQDVPALRIVDDALWHAVKARQTHASRATRPDAGRREIWHARRPKHLLSGLIRCGACGGSVIQVGKAYYGCANYKNRGTCTNKLSMRMDMLEGTVLAGLKERLLTPELVAAFVCEFQQVFNRQQAEQGQRRHQLQAEIGKVERQIAAIVAAVKDGLYHAAMKDELTRLEERRTTLTQELSAEPAPAPAIHPNLAELYRRKVESLHEALNEEGTRAEAAEALRTLIEEIRLVPQDGRLRIDLHGELATILALTNETPASRRRDGRSTLLVAGAGFEPTTFRL